MIEKNTSETLVQGAPTPASSPGSKPRKVSEPPVPHGAADRRTAEKAKTGPVPGVLKIAVFFLLVGLIAFALQLFFNHGLRKIKTSKFGSFNKIMTGAVNAEILINGSSRALSHYDPRVIQTVTGHSSYNIGMNASQIDLQLAMLKTYLKHNATPKIVIQNLDLFSFETTRKGEIYDPGYLVPYLYEDELYQPLRKIDPVVWKWKNIPLYGYAVEDMRFTWIWAVLGAFGVDGREDYFQGFNPRDAVWNLDFEQYKAQNRSGVTFRIEPAGVAAMEELIQYCSSKNIPVVLVYSPEYYEMQGMELNRPDIVGKFRDIATRLHAQFWDYSDSDLSRRQELFQNSQHLNATGATAFSAALARRLATDYFPAAQSASTVGNPK